MEKINKKIAFCNEFYSQAIKKVEQMTEKELNAENAFMFLLDIDNEIADKHRIKISRKKKIETI